MLTDWGTQKECVPGFEARRGGELGMVENVGLIYILPRPRRLKINLSCGERRRATEGRGKLVARRERKPKLK